MKHLIVALLALMPFSAFCQSPATIASGKLAVGLVFSPDYCFRTLSSDASSQWIGGYRKNMEGPKFGYTAGTSLVFRPTPRIGLEGGVLLSDKGERSSNLAYVTPDPIDPRHPTSGWDTYHYVYLDIPVKVNYYILTGKARLFVSAGISTNIFLKYTEKSSREYSDGSKEKSSVSSNPGFNKVNFAAVAGFGMDYDITDKLRLRAEPIYRHSVTPIIDTPIKSFLYSAGVNFGVYYKL